jgi:glycosyltransferase involved in cell wall biosynthesis
MKIFFFKFPLEPSLGGAEFQTLTLAKHFQSQGHSVQLVSSDGNLFRLFEQADLPRKRIFIGWEPTSGAALVGWPLTYLAAKLKLHRLFESVPADSAFFFQSLTEKLLFTHIAKKKGGKIFWLEHKVPGTWLKHNPLLPRYRYLAQQAKLITVSKFAREEFIKLGIKNDNLYTIYPGVEESPKNSEVLPGLTVGILSRLAPEKGIYELLLELLPALKAHPEWKILIAGVGPEQLRIKKLIGGKQVELLGFVPGLAEFFSLISVLAYPSKVAESFGLATAQAQAFGVPVIASNIGALPEIILHKKNGFLVGPGKPGEWLEYLRILANPSYRKEMGKAAAHLGSRFTQAKMFARFDTLLQKN